MVSPTELDIFNRSLGGDRRARTDLYKKFVYGSSRVRRVGAGYPDLTDFLHDCFNNLLRTGHSWDKEESLTTWVESVAVWTAMGKARQHELHALGARGEIRMCAEIEGEDIVRGEVLPAYAPPLSGPEDSPAARILALLNDTEKMVFRKRALENASWEETAAAAAKPLSAIGQVFARVTAKIARLFGAPPPMDDDLVPVFSRVFANPTRPEGRAVSLQLDIAFYTLTPEMRSIGITSAYEARMLVLWDAARQNTPPADDLRRHLDNCHYCADLLRALLLMEQALLSAPGAGFHLCPGAFTLANAPDLVREAFDQHLAQCAICREERSQALEGHASRQALDPSDQPVVAGAGKKIAWGLAALLLLAALSVGGYYYFRTRNTISTATTAALTNDKPQPTVAADPRYKDLVQDVPMDDQRVLASVLPANRDAIRFALNQFALGQAQMALSVSAQIARKSDDPGAETIYAMSLFRTQLITDAYREMLKAEAMSPRDSFRCWIMLQFSLAVADKAVIEREAQHLLEDPQYKDRAQKILERVRERG
jgi:DNA-directed RNA polymerase specialized sigma24 family protein